MHPRHQAFLVIGTVEDADAAAPGQRKHGAPQVIMLQLEGGRLFEACDLAALRIDAFEDVLDRRVLAGRVHPLQDQKHRPAVLGVKLLLEFAQELAVGLETLFGLLLVEAALRARLVRPEVKFARAVDAERRDELLEFGSEGSRRGLFHRIESSRFLIVIPGRAEDAYPKA